jgi:hypothetical protein
MIRRFALFTLAAFALFTLPLIAPPAQAAPSEPVTALVQLGDGGQPEPVALTPQRTYSLQCKENACARFYKASLMTDGGPSINCAAASTALDLPTDSTTLATAARGNRLVFQSGGLDRLKVAAADGGNPNCALALETVNTSSP